MSWSGCEINGVMTYHHEQGGLTRAFCPAAQDPNSRRSIFKL